MKRSRGIVVLMLAGLWLSAFIGCSQPTPEELASLAAKGYYDHLIRGEYEHFLEGLDERPNIDSADYRSQLLDCYAQFVAQQENDHRGILEVRVSNDKRIQYKNIPMCSWCFAMAIPQTRRLSCQWLSAKGVGG